MLDRLVSAQGAGVYYGAGSSEASLCGNEHVFVVGGGNSAGQAVLHFARYAKRLDQTLRPLHDFHSWSSRHLTIYRSRAEFNVYNFVAMRYPGCRLTVSQFSTARPSTRENSRMLSVTSVRPSASA